MSRMDAVCFTKVVKYWSKYMNSFEIEDYSADELIELKESFCKFQKVIEDRINGSTNRLSRKDR